MARYTEEEIVSIETHLLKSFAGFILETMPADMADSYLNDVKAKILYLIELAKDPEKEKQKEKELLEKSEFYRKLKGVNDIQ